ncbi:MAG: arginine decarboxylase [Saprospiraceae bacterium]
MNNTYADLIDQTFDFPTHSLALKDEQLHFHGVNIAALMEKYGSPLKVYYLPSIGEKIEEARKLFKGAIRSLKYKGKYHFAYCTKASHFHFVMREVLASDALLETSSAYDVELIRRLHAKGRLKKKNLILHNGYKPTNYLDGILGLVADGFNSLPIIDNPVEFDYLSKNLPTDAKLKIGLRVATEEEPKFEFYTSRLGIRAAEIKEFYNSAIEADARFELRMLHFFVDTGIQDTSYYWNELRKAVRAYAQLRKKCPTLTALNIGGGLPIQNGLGDDYDYPYLIREIVRQVLDTCRREGVPQPDLYSEFGKFTVGESGATLFEVIGQKQQNDSELWYMIDNSLMTALPDTWGISERFILLPVEQWDGPPVRVNLGGLTCDNSDFYNSETHGGQVYLPKFDSSRKRLRLGFFHTGAYQDALSGYGGIRHCLIPAMKRVLIAKDEQGNLKDWLDAPEQSSEDMMKLLGY